MIGVRSAVAGRPLRDSAPQDEAQLTWVPLPLSGSMAAMSLHLVAVHHADQGLGAVETVAPSVPGLGRRLTAHAGVDGAVVLSTCNRVEVYVDSEASPAEIASLVRSALTLDAAQPVTVHTDAPAVDHLFRVAAGLDSVVVGDRRLPPRSVAH